MGINNTVRWRQNFLRARRSKPARRLLRSLSNEDGEGDGDGNEKGKKAIGLQLCHAFLYISLMSLHDYNVKVPNFTLRRVREHKTMTFFTFPGLWYSLLEFNSRKFANIWRIEPVGISVMKFEVVRIHFLNDISVAIVVVVA